MHVCILAGRKGDSQVYILAIASSSILYRDLEHLRSQLQVVWVPISSAGTHHVHHTSHSTSHITLSHGTSHCHMAHHTVTQHTSHCHMAHHTVTQHTSHCPVHIALSHSTHHTVTQHTHWPIQHMITCQGLPIIQFDRESKI